jgi:multiple sugar transport system ATP-binding protein
MNFTPVVISDEGGVLYASNPAMKIRVPEALAARLGPHSGKPATLGIRPESLRMATSADAAGTIIEATVEVSEQLGSEVILDVKVADGAMVASVEPTVRVKPGEPVKLALDPGGLRFFDATTEKAI